MEDHSWHICSARSGRRDMGAGCRRGWASSVHQPQPRALQLQRAGRRWLWKECLQLQIPTEKDKGNRCREIPGLHFSPCSCGLKPLQLARLPREGLYKARCPFSKSHPHPLLPPPAVPMFLFPSFPTNAVWRKAGHCSHHHSVC